MSSPCTTVRYARNHGNVSNDIPMFSMMLAMVKMPRCLMCTFCIVHQKEQTMNSILFVSIAFATNSTQSNCLAYWHRYCFFRNTFQQSQLCLYIWYYTGVGSLPNVYIEWILLYNQGSQHCGKSISYFDVPDEMNSHLINNVPLDMAYLYTLKSHLNGGSVHSALQLNGFSNYRNHKCNPCFNSTYSLHYMVNEIINERSHYKSWRMPVW